MSCRCRTRASVRPPRPAPTIVTGAVMSVLSELWTVGPTPRLDRWSNCVKMMDMTTPAPRNTRRSDALSRDRIIAATIEVLDATGEAGLTVRALTAHLSTGRGAIYHHVANKEELLAA